MTLFLEQFLNKLATGIGVGGPRVAAGNHHAPNRLGGMGLVFLSVVASHTFYRMLKKAAICVLGSKKSSTGTRPPHHSAARTDVVLLIRRTVRPRGYASALRSLRPCPRNGASRRAGVGRVRSLTFLIILKLGLLCSISRLRRGSVLRLAFRQ